MATGRTHLPEYALKAGGCTTQLSIESLGRRGLRVQGDRLGVGLEVRVFSGGRHAQEGHGTPLSTIGFWGGALRLPEVCYIGLIVFGPFQFRCDVCNSAFGSWQLPVTSSNSLSPNVTQQG